MRGALMTGQVDYSLAEDPEDLAAHALVLAGHDPEKVPVEHRALARDIHRQNTAVLEQIEHDRRNGIIRFDDRRRNRSVIFHRGAGGSLRRETVSVLTGHPRVSNRARASHRGRAGHRRATASRAGPDDSDGAGEPPTAPHRATCPACGFVLLWADGSLVCAERGCERWGQ
jgi:hypothetical protein